MVTVLSAVAWMSLSVVTNNADQVRFDDTRNRLAAIRRAIIGDTSRTVNGQTEIRGYVADMGRLPNNLEELMTQGTQSAFGEDATTGLRRGWNGPYLPPGFGSNGRYRDGWGNDDSLANHGWVYSPNAGDLTVQSLGRDGAAGGTAGSYDADYPTAAAPPLIDESEYRREINTITMVLDFSTAPQCFSCRNPHGNSADCATNGGTWRDGYCLDHPTYTTKVACNGSNWTWVVDESCSYTTETRCTEHHGTWKAIETYVCSNPDHLKEADCLANGSTWYPITSHTCTFASEAKCSADGGTWDEDTNTTSSGCKAAASTWQPNVQVCMSIAYVTDGAVSAAPYSSEPVTVSWNGARTAVAFDFDTSKLSQGQAAYALTAGSPCPTNISGVTEANTFPAGARLWTPFTYVPGTTLSFERKISQ